MKGILTQPNVTLNSSSFSSEQELWHDVPAGVGGDGQRGGGGERAAGQLHRLLRPARRLQQHRLPRHRRIDLRHLPAKVAPQGTHVHGNRLEADA